MKSKRAAIGNLVSNYFSLIFLAIILGSFIFLSPLIKIAVGGPGDSEESYDLREYKALFHKAKDAEKDFILNEKTLNSKEFFICPNKLPNEKYIYFHFNSKNELILSIDFVECPINEISVECSEMTQDKQFCMTYSFNSKTCDHFNNLEITPLIHSDFNSLKGKSYEEQLDYFSRNKYSLEEVYYE